MKSDQVRVGLFPPYGLLELGQDTARAYLARAGQAGIDHVCCGDHVSFFAGLGFDGLVQAAALAMLHPTLPVYTGVYLLRYCPYGTPEDVAGFLAPYVAAGCTEFNLIPQVPGDGDAIGAVAEVKRLLAR